MPPDERVLSCLRKMEARTIASSADGRETRQIGPFLAVTHPTNELIWLSYALILPGAREEDVTPATLAALREHFRQRGRILRFEILDPLRPWLGSRLEALGVQLQGRMPLMICFPEQLQIAPCPDGFTLAWLHPDDPDELLAEYIRTGRICFGGPGGDVAPREIAEQREHLAARRYRCMYARGEGQVAGIGAMSCGNDELVGVGTLPTMRRRGIAAAISSRVVADHFERGAEAVWLSAGDEAAAALYAKIGFRRVGVQLNYADP